MRVGPASAALLAPLALSAGCLALEEPAVGERAYEIVDGTPSTHPAVVLLELGDTLCTGTMVSPRVVLTAAHCLVGSATALSAEFVNQIGEQGVAIPGVTQEKHATRDIGVLLLSQPAPVLPVAPNQTPLEGAVGTQVRIVGFGVTSETGQDGGVKREGMASLASVTPDGAKDVLEGEMVTSNEPQGTCYGDSGGPNFMTLDGVEVIVGVTSRGTLKPSGDTYPCGEGEDIAVRVDSHYSWLRGFIDANDPDAEPPDPGPDPGPGSGPVTGGCRAVDTGAASGWFALLILTLASRKVFPRRGR